MAAGIEWSEVVGHLRAHYSASRQEDSAIRIDVARKKTRQSIVVLASESFELPCVTFVAMLGRADNFVHREALEACSHLLAGGLLVRDDMCLFRVSMPLASLTPRVIDELVVFVAAEAIRIRTRAMHRSRAVDPHAFASAL